jgi:hypothetical protein
MKLLKLNNQSQIKSDIDFRFNAPLIINNTLFKSFSDYFDNLLYLDSDGFAIASYLGYINLSFLYLISGKDIKDHYYSTKYKAVYNKIILNSRNIYYHHLIEFEELFIS